MKHSIGILLLLLGSIVLAAPVAAAGPDVTGFWLTEKGKVSVELFHCGDELCGRIAWLANPTAADGGLKRDTQNPDPTLRDRPWCGMTVITELEPAGPGRWRSGRFYYPKHGREYSLKLKRKGDRLKVRAYVGLELLGKTEHWTRAAPDLRGCSES